MEDVRGHPSPVWQARQQGEHVNPNLARRQRVIKDGGGPQHRAPEPARQPKVNSATCGGEPQRVRKETIVILS